MQTFDLVVIGAGPGGYVAAIRAAQLGMNVALVEKDEVGGTCLNKGCIPTKALLHSAELYAEAKNSFKSLGILVQGLEYSEEGMYARKDEVVAAQRTGIENLLKANGVVLFKGYGTVPQSGIVDVQTGGAEQRLTTKNILIATGGKPMRLPIVGADLPNVVTSDDLLQNPKVYSRIVIVGAGVIGVEFASMYTSLGCDVVMIEAAPCALPLLSRELGRSVAMMLKKRGASLLTSCALQRIEQEGDALCCVYTLKGEEKRTTGEAVLLATGRQPVADGVFSGDAKPKTEKGYLRVNDKFQTSMQDVYAVGDAIIGMQLAHVASAEGVAAVEAMMGKKSSVRLDLIPSCVYTQPEIACVGLNEETAALQGVDVSVGKYLMGGNGRTTIEKTDRSYIKLLAEKSTGRLLGAELLCPRATDLVGGISIAIAEGLTAKQVENTIFAHPTFAEGVGEAVALLLDKCIHMPPRTSRAK